MEFNKLVFAGLSVGCLAAAAGGSFLAVRQNQSSAYALPEHQRAPARRRRNRGGPESTSQRSPNLKA